MDGCCHICQATAMNDLCRHRAMPCDGAQEWHSEAESQMRAARRLGHRRGHKKNPTFAMREGSVCSALVSPRISRRRCMREGGQATSSVHPNPIPHGRHSGNSKSTERRMLAMGAQKHAPPLKFYFCWDRPLNCHAKGNKLTRRSPEAATQHHKCLTTLGADRCLMATALSISSGARYKPIHTT